MFVDTIVVTDSNVEQRNNQHSRPARQWTIGYEGYDLCHEVRNFFHCRDGRQRGFRFKDWNDYLIDSSAPVPAVELTATTFQIVRKYTDGLITKYENVTKPVIGTVHVWDGSSDVDPSEFTVDHTTGIITFDVNPSYAPAISCEYDHPARFTTRDLRVQATDSLRSIQRLGVLEIFDAS